MTRIDKVAWIRLADGRILSTRSRGKDVYYLPGGKREPAESDVQTRVREIREELGVAIAPGSEMAEFGWLSYADRDRVSPVDQIIFDHLHGRGRIG
jgi:8-oxo-dGTP diphosphatase